jgi:hypothetical protein
MVFRFSLILCLLICFWQNSYAQKSAIVFKPVFGDSSLVINHTYHLSASDSIQFTTLKFYISGLTLSQNGKTVWHEENSVHLIDIENSKSLVFFLSIPSKLKYTQIVFQLGIDSTTNTSGAMGGDLDPTKGMYWAWQSGYINFKLEGTSNLCQTIKNEFQFHLGGYAKPYNSLTKVCLEFSPTSSKTISIDLKKLVSDIDFKNHNHVMSPSIESVTLSKKLAKIFKTY